MVYFIDLVAERDLVFPQLRCYNELGRDDHKNETFKTLRSIDANRGSYTPSQNVAGAACTGDA